MNRPFRSLLASASAAALCATPAALAQTYPPAGLQRAEPTRRLQISAFTGWQLNGDVDAGAARLVVDDAQSFGASVSVAARPGTRGEFLWLYSRARARIESFSALYPSSRPFDVDANYFQLGGVQSMKRGRLEPFVGGTLGAVWYAPENAQAQSGNLTYDLSDTWRFAFTLGAGANVFLNRTETLALHLHARMLVPVNFTGGGFYVGSGGSGVSVSGGIPTISGDFGVGLALAR